MVLPVPMAGISNLLVNVWVSDDYRSLALYHSDSSDGSLLVYNDDGTISKVKKGEVWEDMESYLRALCNWWGFGFDEVTDDDFYGLPTHRLPYLPLSVMTPVNPEGGLNQRAPLFNSSALMLGERVMLPLFSYSGLWLHVNQGTQQWVYSLRDGSLSTVAISQIDAARRLQASEMQEALANLVDNDVSLGSALFHITSLQVSVLHEI